MESLSQHRASLRSLPEHTTEKLQAPVNVSSPEESAPKGSPAALVEDSGSAVLSEAPASSASDPHHVAGSTDRSPNVRDRVLCAKEHEIAHLRRTVQELSVQLNDALHALDRREDASAELSRLKTSSLSKDERRDGEVRNIRLEMLESRVRLRAKEEQLTSQFDDSVRAKATELLASHTQQVHQENSELQKEKRVLVKEATSSRAQYKELQDKHARLRQETELDEDANKELLQRSVLQKKEIAALRQQIKSYEDNLNAVVAAYDTKLKAQEIEHKGVATTLTKERDAARLDAMQLQRELRQLRGVAGTLLTQRGELEEFFYAALEDVKHGVVEERRQLRLLDGGDTTRLPPATSAQNAKAELTAPAQTTSSFLRLEVPERLRLTGKRDAHIRAATPLTSWRSHNEGWTVDRKGLPKRIAAASARTSCLNGASASAGAGAATPVLTASPSSTLPCSGRFLPQVVPPTSMSPRPPALSPSPAPAIGNSDRAVVAVPDSTPAYLRHADEAATSHLATSFSTTIPRESEEAPNPWDSSADAGAALSRRVSRHAASLSKASNGSAHSNGVLVPSPPPPPTLKILPAAPGWKDVKQVEIAALSWADKERVIRLLFQRIRQEGRHRALLQERQLQKPAVKEKTANAEEEDAMHAEDDDLQSTMELDHDSTTFLTQQ